MPLLDLDNGTAFIDISNPIAPIYVGKLSQQMVLHWTKSGEI